METENKNNYTNNILEPFEIDPNLKKAIEGVTGLTIVTKDDVNSLTGYLDLSYSNIFQYLDIGVKLESLKGLQYAKNITQLYLSDNNISDITELSELTQLTWLEINNNKVSNITPLATLVNLEGLNINKNPVTTLFTFNGFINLKTLRMRSISSTKTLSILPNLLPLQNVIVLDLIDNNITTLIDSNGNCLLPNVSNLLTLGLSQNKLQSITALSNAINIQNLYLSNNNIIDISPLSNRTSLQILYLNSNKVTDLTPISTLINLILLQLVDCEISDIRFLSKNVNLQELALDKNNIQNLTPLSSLTNLESLSLTYNKIEDITPLSSIKTLSYIYLDNNYIRDISSLITIFDEQTSQNSFSILNQYVAIPPQPINNQTATINISTILKDLYGNVPNSIGQISNNGVNKNNVITWTGINSTENLSFLFSNGIYNPDTLLWENEYFSGNVIQISDVVVVSIPDDNLLNQLYIILNISPGTPITIALLKTLPPIVDLSNENIYDLTGLEYGINIKTLNISGNHIANLCPLLGLSNLDTVISDNQTLKYPIQTTDKNGQLRVSLNFITPCGDTTEPPVISNISNNGYVSGNEIIWERIYGNINLSFDYKVTFIKTSRNRSLTSISSYGNAIIPVSPTSVKINRGVNIFLCEGSDIF